MGNVADRRKNQFRCLVVVEIGQGSEGETEFLEIFTLDKADRAEINEHDAAIAQQGDISRMQISVG